MTNKEAIERLEYIKTHHTDPEDYELFDFAIKALEQNGTPVSTEGDLISREALKEAISELSNDNPSYYYTGFFLDRDKVLDEIDNAPTVPLRLMTVEECAGHTIDYAMGWKACIEWVKKGGAE